jgi:aminoglycoside phosphotransferase (APT) family kinase protein
MDPERALRAFDIEFNHIRREPAAALSRVYIIDNKYVLRSTRTTIIDLLEGIRLRRKVATFVPYSFPRYQRTITQESYVKDGPVLWLLYKYMPGNTLGNWMYFDQCSKEKTELVFRTLQILHDRTVSKFRERDIRRHYFVDDIRLKLAEMKEILTRNEILRLGRAIENVSSYVNRLAPAKFCFVHGDFHHGNILCENGVVTGLIDVDWCRVGTAYEDLAYLIMMLMRDYRCDFAFDTQMYAKYIKMAAVRDLKIFSEYMLLYVLFDTAITKTIKTKRYRNFYRYQLDFLRYACKNL